MTDPHTLSEDERSPWALLGERTSTKHFQYRIEFSYSSDSIILRFVRIIFY